MEGLRRKEGLGMSMLYCFLEGFRPGNERERRDLTEFGLIYTRKSGKFATLCGFPL